MQWCIIGFSLIPLVLTQVYFTGTIKTSTIYLGSVANTKKPFHLIFSLRYAKNFMYVNLSGQSQYSASQFYIESSGPTQTHTTSNPLIISLLFDQ